MKIIKRIEKSTKLAEYRSAIVSNMTNKIKAIANKYCIEDESCLAPYPRKKTFLGESGASGYKRCLVLEDLLYLSNTDPSKCLDSMLQKAKDSICDEEGYEHLCWNTFAYFENTYSLMAIKEIEEAKKSYDKLEKIIKEIDTELLELGLQNV
jgi:hypothetical protein